MSKNAERRPAGSIKLPSPAPAAVPVAAATAAVGQRSRLSQQVQLRNSPAARGRRVTTSAGPDADEDAEGEEDLEEDAMDEGGDTEDKELYCFCRKLSYGEVRRWLGSASHMALLLSFFSPSPCCLIEFLLLRALLYPPPRIQPCVYGHNGGSAGQTFCF